MIQALQLSFQSLSDRRVAMLLIKVVLCTFASFLLLGIGMWFALDWLFAWLNIQNGAYLSAFLSLAIIPISAFLLFRVVAVAITWIFADDIIDAVEDRYYPQKAAFGKRHGQHAIHRLGHAGTLSQGRQIQTSRCATTATAVNPTNPWIQYRWNSWASSSVRPEIEPLR